MAKNALQYITKSDPRYQYGAMESEAGPSNAFDTYLNQMPQTEDYWRRLGYGGDVLSGTNSDATDQQISPELLAYIQSRGLQLGNDGENAMNALIGPDGNPVAGSEYSVDDTGDFFRDALLVAGGGYLGGSALAGAAGGSGLAGSIANGALAGGAQGGALGALGATEGGLAALGGAAGGSFVGDIGGQSLPQDFSGFQNVGAQVDAATVGGYGPGMNGAETGIYDAGIKTAGGGNFMSGLGDFFSGNGSASDYLRAAQFAGGLYAQNKAAGAAQSGNDAQNALLSQMYQQNRADNQPLLDMRNQTLPQIQNLLKNPGSITSDPGYQFGLKQGANQLNNRAAASGNYYSGAQMKAAQQYGQDYAGTKLDQSLNRLTTVAGLGQVGANNNQSNNTNFGTQGGNALQQGGNIRGSGYLGQFNTANNAANGWMQDQLDRKYWGGGG
jgi:hypothetical protein